MVVMMVVLVSTASTATATLVVAFVVVVITIAVVLAVVVVRVVALLRQTHVRLADLLELLGRRGIVLTTRRNGPHMFDENKFEKNKVGKN